MALIKETKKPNHLLIKWQVSEICRPVDIPQPDIGIMVRVFANGFNLRSSHTKDFKNGT